jgi:hypothetical protein
MKCSVSEIFGLSNFAAWEVSLFGCMLRAWNSFLYLTGSRSRYHLQEEWLGAAKDLPSVRASNSDFIQTD